MIARLRAWHAFLILWFVTFLVGLNLAPEANVIVMLMLTLLYSSAAFATAFTVVWLGRRGTEGVLLATILILAILVPSVAAGSYYYRYRDSRYLPGDLFARGAAYIDGLIWPGSTPPPQVARVSVTPNLGPAWAQQFMAIVNSQRQAAGLPPLRETYTLDDYAGVRAHTTMAYYWITHYGRDHDFSCFFQNCLPPAELGRSYYVFNQTALYSVLGKGASYQRPASGEFWPLVLSCAKCDPTTVYFSSEQAIVTYFELAYGPFIQVLFGVGNAFSLVMPIEPNEEILYPTGSPYSYASGLQRNAALHWTEFLDGDLRTYGFHIDTGVAYITHGCTISEIPGPDIDLRVFYSQNGCSFDYALTEWLVIELGR